MYQKVSTDVKISTFLEKNGRIRLWFTKRTFHKSYLEKTPCMLFLLQSYLQFLRWNLIHMIILITNKYIWVTLYLLAQRHIINMKDVKNLGKLLFDVLHQSMSSRVGWSDVWVCFCFVVVAVYYYNYYFQIQDIQTF